MLNNVAAVVFSAILVEATNTTIASTILSIKLFGVQIALYIALVNTVSFAVTGYRSIFSTQVISKIKILLIWLILKPNTEKHWE